MSRTGNRTGTKTKIRKWCQGKTKGTIARARRTRYVGPRINTAALAERIADAVEPVSFDAPIEPELRDLAAKLKLRCAGKTRAGEQCSRAAKAGTYYCAQHTAQAVVA